MRTFLIAIVLVSAMAGTAEARRGGIVIIVTGDDIEHVRDLDAETAAQVGYHKLGYHYDRFGLFWLDLWRSGGEFVVYDGNTYVPITGDELAQLGGASVPWRYHLPPLLLLILAVIELVIVGRKQRKVKLGLYVGGALIAIAALFYVKGLTWEFMIPGFLGLYHVLVSYWAMRDHGDQVEDAESEPSAETPSGTHRTTTSGAYRTIGSGAYDATTSGAYKTSRSGAFQTSSSGAMAPLGEPTANAAEQRGPIPSRPSQPIVIERPSQPAAAPMRRDDNADAPKLLR